MNQEEISPPKCPHPHWAFKKGNSALYCKCCRVGYSFEFLMFANDVLAAVMTSSKCRSMPLA